MDRHNYTYQSDFAKKYVAEGIKRGYRETLGKLLQQRFGALPTDLVARLDEADIDTLGTWIGRVLTAGSLADVFASDPS